MTLLEAADLAGVAVFAVSGALAAARKNLDLLGVLVIAIVTAIGGGTLRDLLLDRPVFWTVRPVYLHVIAVAAMATVVYARRFHPPDRALAIMDAFGLAFFTVSGAQIAEGLEHAGAVVIVMGVLTGVAGGALRDVLTGEIPLILRKGQLYATASLAGATLYLVLQAYVARNVASLCAMALISALRLGAIAFNWSLPVVALRRRADD